MVAELFKREDGSLWINPEKRAKVWKWDEKGGVFILQEAERLAWLKLDDDADEVAKLVPFDPGDRVMHAAQQRQDAERASRQPDINDFNRLNAMVKDSPEEFFVNAPGGKKGWLMIALVENGADFKYAGEGLSPNLMTAPWSAIDAVEKQLLAFGSEYGEREAPAYRAEMQQHMAQHEPEKTYSSADYRKRYEAVTARANDAGIDKTRCQGIWGGTATRPDTIEFSEDRLVQYEARLEALIKGETNAVENVSSQTGDVAGPEAKASGESLVESSAGLQVPNAAEASPAEEQTNAGSEGGEDANRGGASELVPGELMPWFEAQDPEYQEFFLTGMTPEERAEELKLVTIPPATTVITSVTIIEAETTSVPDAKVEDAGPATESASETTADRKSTTSSNTSSERGGGGEVLYMNGLVRTEEGYIVDADGVIINEETAFALFGLNEAFDIRNHDDLAIFAGKINDIQARIERRCKSFVNRTMPLFDIRDRMIRHYHAQLHLFGDKNLPRWDKDAKPGVKNPHAAGELKAKSIKTEEGTVYYRQLGGWKVENESAIREEIMKEMDLTDLNVLLPAHVREKYGARLQLTFSKKKIYGLADAGAFFRGLARIPIVEIGKIGIGDADSKSMWTPEPIAKLVRAALKRAVCTFKGVEYTPGSDSEDDDEAEDAA